MHPAPTRLFEESEKKKLSRVTEKSLKNHVCKVCVILRFACSTGVYRFESRLRIMDSFCALRIRYLPGYQVPGMYVMLS